MARHVVKVKFGRVLVKEVDFLSEVGSPSVTHSFLSSPFTHEDCFRKLSAIFAMPFYYEFFLSSNVLKPDFCLQIISES